MPEYSHQAESTNSLVRSSSSVFILHVMGGISTMTSIGISSEFLGNRDLLLAILPLFESKAEHATRVVTSNQSKNHYNAFLYEIKLLRSNLPKVSISTEERDEAELAQHVSAILKCLENLVGSLDTPRVPAHISLASLLSPALSRYDSLTRFAADC
jgi:hypothetical protein